MKYKCRICGYVFDEEAEGMSFSDLEKCPVCQQSPHLFLPIIEEPPVKEAPPVKEEPLSKEDAPVAEDVPADEETPVAEDVPADEETPVAEDVPADEETPVAEDMPVNEGAPVSEEASVTERSDIKEEYGLEEIPAVDDSSDVDENTVLDETPVIDEKSDVEESSDTGETSDTDDFTDIADHPDTDESADIAEHPDTGEFTDIAEHLETDESADIADHPDTDEFTDIAEHPETDELTDIVENSDTEKNIDIREESSESEAASDEPVASETASNEPDASETASDEPDASETASDEPVDIIDKSAPVDHSAKPYDSLFLRQETDERYMDEIHDMAVKGESIHAAMSTQLPLPKWEDILLLGAQLDPAPLNDDEAVSVRTVIGAHAKKPMVLESPVYISHMSFGALSKETKIALAKGSSAVKTAMCSGEGGILPEEKAASYKYIFEYIPNKYSVTDENLREADAIEIKIGQGTKPGMGGHLPGSKVTEEIAALRGRKPGEDIQSPSRFPEISSRWDLMEMVSMLRIRSEGRPIGIKIAAGHIEQDLAYALFAKPDFITIDGRGGATGSSPFFLREATSVPTIYALARARKYLNQVRSDVALVITGGLRVSADFAKAIALGADAIAVASGALIAAACQQYRICGSGYCPAGIATQNPELRARLNIDDAAKRVANYLRVSTEELKTFARISGVKDIHDLSLNNLVTLDNDIATYTGIRHAGVSGI